jgi:hypothetical protein
MVAVAIGGAALIGGAATVAAGNKAASAQKEGARLSSETERYFYDTTRADQAPFREVGLGALNRLAQMYGVAPAGTTTSNTLPTAAGVTGGTFAPPAINQTMQPIPNPDYSDQAALDYFMAQVGPKRTQTINNYFSRNPGLTAAEKLNYALPYASKQEQGLWANYTAQNPKTIQRPAPTSSVAAPGLPAFGAEAPGGGVDDGFHASPGYAFRRSEGLKAIERSSAARGLLNSGAADKARMRYADGLASSEYDTYANRLAALAGVGQTATNATQQAGAQAAQGISQAQMAAGNARASSYANTGSAINSGVNNLASLYLYQNGGGFGGGGTYGGTPPIYGGNLGGIY